MGASPMHHRQSDARMGEAPMPQISDHMAFRFLDPGPLIDRELELVAPSERWIDPVLQTCAHPTSVGDERCDLTTRGSLMDFLQAAPRGRQEGDGKSRVPSYSFW